MDFAGFDFRNNADGAGFPGDPAGNIAVRPSTALYSASQGYGFSGSLVGASFANPVDGRLGGYILISSSGVSFRIDVPNGAYDIRLALGSSTAATTGLRITYGSGTSDFIELGNTTTGTASNVDAAGNVVSDSAWAASPATVRVTVTNNRLLINRAVTANNNAYLKHFSYRAVPGPLQPTTISSDDSLVTVAATGTTTAGSSTVALATPTIGLFEGMYVNGPAIPAGTTIATVGAPINAVGSISTVNKVSTVTIPSTPDIYPGMFVAGNGIPAGYYVGSVGARDANGAITSFTLSNYVGVTDGSGVSIAISGKDSVLGAATSIILSSGTGVTALPNGALTFGFIPTLEEKNPQGKIIGPLQFPVGSVANLAVLSSDGTPNPYLGIKVVNSVPCLAYLGLPFPGTATTYTFSISQTDNSGVFTGSPYVTSFTMPVTLAPTKPTDNSLLGKISTKAFVLRKQILDKQAVTKWPGYRRQAFYPSGDVLVNSLSGLLAALQSFSAQAAANRWFRIRCTNAFLAQAADWNTSPANNTGFSVNFLPESGGGCLIENDAGQNVLIRGNTYTGPQRGVHYRGLTFCNTNTESMRMDYSSAKALAVVMTTGCKFGYLFDPNFSEADYANPNSPSFIQPNAQNGIRIVGAADQLSVLDCVFFGTRVGISAAGCRVAEIGWNSWLMSSDDYMELTTIKVGSYVITPFQGMPDISDQDCYVHIHNNSGFHSVDNPDSYGYNPVTGVFAGPHGDGVQVIPFYAPASRLWIVFEGNSLLNNLTKYITDTAHNGTIKNLTSRQFMINNAEARTMGVYLNNVGMNATLRGLDFGGGGDGYAEYNTMLPAPVLPPTITSSQGILMGVFNTTTGRSRCRKNITGFNGNETVAKNFAYEDEYKVLLDGTSSKAAVEAVLTGPFNPDGDSSGRLTYAYGTDTSTTTDNAHRKGIWPALIPKVDAGAQFLSNRLRPGDSDTLKSAEAATLVAVTDAQPTGAIPGVVSLRWNSGSGETGAQVGSDVSFTVQ